MGFFFEGYTWPNILGVIGLVAALMVLNEMTRRSKVAGIAVFCVLPLVIFTLIAMGVVGTPSTKTWFGAVKTCSALIGVIGFMLIRYTSLGEKKFAWYFPVTILAINILEAIYRDCEIFVTYKTMTVDPAGLTMLGGVWNLMNAAAGVFLLLSMTGWAGVRVAKTPSKDMVWADMLWFWIIAYDLWNMAYCYNCISTRSMYAGMALLASCTLAEFFIKRGAWLQHRAHTLALFGMFSLVVDYDELPVFTIISTYDATAWTALSALALIVNVSVFAYEIHYIMKTGRNPIRQEMYIELPDYQRNLKANRL